MSLGFEQAGFDVVAAVEIDPIHAAAHKFNFPHCEVLAQSVIGLSGPEIRRRAGIEGRQVDVVFGGAPCQGFSLIGHRALDDPRNALVNEFVRLVTELDSSYFVFENVKGLTVGRHKELLNEIIKEFENRGYAVRKSWSVLNAVNFGVPQHRERLILMGAKEGLPLPVYPSGNSASANRREFFSGPTCRDALEDLPNAEDFPELISSDEVETDAWGKPSAYAKEMRCIENEAWHSGYVRRWNSSLLTSSMRTDHTEVSRRRFASISGGEVEPISRFFKLSPDGVSNTLRAGTDAARGAFTSPRPIHYRWARCITVREMARLHGFPDWFRFHETKWHGARQIGNAVPPPLARAVAEQIMLALDIFPTRPKHEIDLGNTAFLKMDMSQAAKFFGVDSPIGRRDRKSGAKKRKQHEIEETRQMFEASNG
jgi:DNA (cytosine-5)-methyltransferase 1